MMYIVELVDEQKITFFEKYYETMECIKSFNFKGYGVTDIQRTQFERHYYLRKIY